MEEYEEGKTKISWKWLLLIPIILIITIVGMVLFYPYSNMDEMEIPIDFSNPIVTTTGTTTTPESYTVKGATILNEYVESSKIISLNPGRYNLVFQSDTNTRVSLKKNPDGFHVCCNPEEPKYSGVYKFDVNSGAGGEYLLTVEPSAHINIGQELTF